MTTDPIADLLTRIRNAISRRKEEVIAPYSKMKNDILNILKDEGYIVSFSVVKDNKFKNLKIVLKYNEAGLSVINNLERVSKPGLRVYGDYRNMKKVLNGMGISIVSTPKGLMTGYRARGQKVGGEILCTIY